MRIALVARVSAEEQKLGYGIEAQQHQIRRYCDARKWTITKEYLDQGITDRDPSRPMFNEEQTRTDSEETP